MQVGEWIYIEIKDRYSIPVANASNLDLKYMPVASTNHHNQDKADWGPFATCTILDDLSNWIIKRRE